MNKLFYQVWCLLDQMNIRDNKTPVSALPSGKKVSVVRFARYQLGE